jgi:hypothetical protein
VPRLGIALPGRGAKGLLTNEGIFVATKTANKKASKSKQSARQTTKPGATAEAVAAASADQEHDETMDDVHKIIADLEKQRDEIKTKSDAVRRRLRSKRKAMHESALALRDADQHKKDCKSAFDKARTEYIREADAIADGQELLPFPEEKLDGKKAAASNGSDHAANEKITALLTKAIKKAVGSDTFENEKIGITDSVIEKLEAADIKTIGDLEKRMRGEDGKFLNQIPGVKDAAIDKISLTLLAYRSVFPVPVESAHAKSNDKPKCETLDEALAAGEAVIKRGDGTVVEGGVQGLMNAITEDFKKEATGAQA